ncbi:hypothetical protein [Massilia scottii]|uniref:hypothetical protein n=1 Tax=Massilia scottii TaxID=3057166 RepID=UPI002796AC12|nr:hypothetical protein [Massilia sp. CCM 9029]MDQ1833935.1 hypothetical protein [Massilia sp. CCM 9029]
MDILILFIGLAAGFFAWRYVSNSSQRRGKGKGHLKAAVAGFFAALISISILLPIFEPESYVKSRADTEAKAKLKAEADAIEAAKTKEMQAAEKAAAAAAEFENKDRKTMAYLMCQRYVKASLKAPASAVFPSSDYTTLKQPGQTYVIRSYVDAHNSFAAMLRSHWHCSVRYNGGEESSGDSWTLIDIKLVAQ